MSRIRRVERREVSPEIVALYDQIYAQRGNVPNMFRTMAHRPEIFRTMMSHFAAVLNTGTVSTALKELIIVRTSQINETPYCLAGGEILEADRIVLATPEHRTRTLLSSLRPASAAPPRLWNRTTTFYYAAARSPLDEPVIALNGEGPTAGPVNHLAVMTTVSPEYAPPGAHLICANIVGAAPDSDDAMQTLEQETRAHLRRWFGDVVRSWIVLAGYPIQHALPMTPVLPSITAAPTDSDVILCGDHVSSPCIHGALLSGRLAAERVLGHPSRPA